MVSVLFGRFTAVLPEFMTCRSVQSKCPTILDIRLMLHAHRFERVDCDNG